jgi:hypothetical protein
MKDIITTILLVLTSILLIWILLEYIIRRKWKKLKDEFHDTQLKGGVKENGYVKR